MDTTKSSRWNVPRRIDRSEYYITVKQTVSQAMSVRTKDSDTVLATVILASLTNSYVEGSAGFTSRLVAVNVKDKSGRVVLFVFATNTNLKARRIRRLFRKRWAIETSYRMINKLFAKTTSKLYLIRIVLLPYNPAIHPLCNAELLLGQPNHSRLAKGVCCSGCHSCVHT